MRVHIDRRFQDALSCDSRPFDHIMSLSGTVLRRKDGRRTIRFAVGGRSFVAKIHREAGWLAILKNLLRFRRTDPGARREWEAIFRLRDLGIPVPEIVAYGERGRSPAKRQSFVVMRDMQDVRTLEEICASWPARAPDVSRKKRILRKCARIVRILHENGINHRDLYICHFFLQERAERSEKIYLYDLHRAQIRRRVPRRWLVKDLAGLYFSSMDAGLSRRDLFRFLREYFQRGLREIFDSKASLLRAAQRRGEALYRKGPAG